MRTRGLFLGIILLFCISVVRAGDPVTRAGFQTLQQLIDLAESGNSNAINDVGYCYENGLHCTKDIDLAFKWYKRAADVGNPYGLHSAGCCYKRGKGTPVDYDKAFDCFKKASKAGNPRSMLELGILYREGKGTPKNPNLSFYWIKNSLDSKLALAYANYALCHLRGIGTPVNLELAWEWYEKAEAAGFDAAKRKNEIIAAGYVPGTSPTVEPSVPEKDMAIADKESEVKIADIDQNIPQSTNTRDNTFAVIIANENYKNESSVPFAINDGNSVRQYVINTLGVPEENVRLAIDATFNEIRSQLGWLKKVSDLYDGDMNVIFYYAGHGMPNEADGQTYLIPVDGISETPTSCFAVDDVYNALNALNTQSTLVMLDACFSGAHRGNGMLTTARGVAIAPKPTPVHGNMVVLTAASGNETAYPYTQKGHGMFTYFLLKKLQETNGAATLGEIYDYVSHEVGRRSVVINDKTQTPKALVSPSMQDVWRDKKL